MFQEKDGALTAEMIDGWQSNGCVFKDDGGMTAGRKEDKWPVTRTMDG